jgi:hypothetical protein
MKSRAIVVVALLAAFAAGGWHATSVSQTTRNEAERSAAPAAGRAQADLNVAYTRAYLKLAQLNLDMAMEANTRYPGTMPDTVLQPLRELVAIAQAELQEALGGKGRDVHALRVRFSEVGIAPAEAALRAAETVNQRSPGTVSPRELERLRLQLEVARLELARARSVGLDLEGLQWQLLDLRKDLLQLQSRVEQLVVRN